MAENPSLASRMASRAADAVTAASVYRRIALDFSAASVKAVESLIAAVEANARVVLDLGDDARVADAVEGLLDLDALGAYYGELFVRHAGATWAEVDWEGRPQPAVTRGGVTVLPHDTIRRRVYDGRHVDVAKIFRREKAAMAKQRGQADPGTPAGT